ncbi:hypothetical protein [Aureimonas sp. ME7]|uniref:hypothetical protein n=1 Tax=Aureimonas sp. ME7 TaxID=2744252 RepID=UPI0015FB476D|nr:hypothetical protein [Aureimonas sp. ME7]
MHVAAQFLGKPIEPPIDLSPTFTMMHIGYLVSTYGVTTWRSLPLINGGRAVEHRCQPLILSRPTTSPRVRTPLWSVRVEDPTIEFRVTRIVIGMEIPAPAIAPMIADQISDM